MIVVKPLGADEFEVTVAGQARTVHRVKVSPDDLARFGHPGETADALLERAFRFLLEREPNTAILPEFPFPLIQHYFPEFESVIRR